MRFWALFKKEWYESVALTLIVFLVVLFFGGVNVQEKANRLQWDMRYPTNVGTTISPYELTVEYPFRDVGGTLAFLSIVFGLKLGISQFWVPNYTKTWPFLLHRSTPRQSILGAKLLCAFLGLVVAMGSAWTLLFVYGMRYQYEFIGYVNMRILLEGWSLLGYGVIAYLVTAIAALLPGDWFSIRFFGLVWGILTLILITMQSQLLWNFLVWVMGAGVLLVLLWFSFLQREFS